MAMTGLACMMDHANIGGFKNNALNGKVNSYILYYYNYMNKTIQKDRY